MYQSSEWTPGGGLKTATYSLPLPIPVPLSTPFPQVLHWFTNKFEMTRSGVHIWLAGIRIVKTPPRIPCHPPSNNVPCPSSGPSSVLLCTPLPPTMCPAPALFYYPPNFPLSPQELLTSLRWRDQASIFDWREFESWRRPQTPSRPKLNIHQPISENTKV